jgi:hypothetical protein
MLGPDPSAGGKRKLTSQPKAASSKRPREIVHSERQREAHVPPPRPALKQNLAQSNRGSETRGGETQPGPSISESKGKQKKVKKTKEELAQDEAKIILGEVQNYFPFGERTFQIPVELFRKPPSNLVCRMMSKTHCQAIVNNMLKAIVQELKVAIIVPFNERKGTFIHLKSNGVTAEKFEQIITKIHFFAISGQHLVEAARVICHNARKDPEKYGAVADRLKLRRAKIIDRAFPQGSHKIFRRHESGEEGLGVVHVAVPSQG